ncbi:biotin/lipoyl-containing protein [Thermorudis peleae]|uniref:biotin/lipoyl-containing protein n=1 Tax=Thermorudis peleae TaxID=1382356 RepID=UPI0005719E39|nr:biotin/lipoyl-containing protein [Thermorudis peleae]MBX6753958.1 biotin/lipoyl-binding protein [Thermorudis peleae]
MQVTASMSGIVSRICVQPGDVVQPGDTVVVLESMKMEVTVATEHGGVVKDVRVREGEFVDEGAVLVELDAGEPA